MGIWHLSWLVLARWTPKPLYRWRSLVLRLFGARIDGTVFVASSARIKLPWNLTLKHRACIGSNAQIYNLAPVELGGRATVAQEVYLCTGTHAFDDPNIPLVIAPIKIGQDAFIGARAYVSPGILIYEGAVVGACSVVTRDVPAWTIYAGNPARAIRPRVRRAATPMETGNSRE